MTREEIKGMTKEQCDTMPAPPYLMMEYVESVRELLDIGTLTKYVEEPTHEHSVEANIECVRLVHMHAVNALSAALYDKTNDECLSIISRVLLDVGALM